MQVIVDRFEGDAAVCEKPDRSMINIPRSKLPAEVKEGDVLIIEGDSILLDPSETQKRKIAIEEKFKRLRQP
jgi:hypothetical protein